MPKVIENVREQLLEEVRRQIVERGYAETTVRSVAGASGLGVGTVYNYFKSKDMLIATVVAEDWKRCTDRFKNSSPKGAEETVRLIYDMLRTFEEEHKSLFTDPEAAKKLADMRKYQCEATTKSRLKMMADAEAGDPEAIVRYEAYLAQRREAYHKKKSEKEETPA